MTDPDNAQFSSYFESELEPNGPTGLPKDLTVSNCDVNTVSVPVLTLTVPDDAELLHLQATRQDTSGTLKFSRTTRLA